MATLDDILGNGGSGGTPPPKGSAGWAEQQGRNSSSANPPKGSLEWAEQNSGDNAQPSTTTVAPPATPTKKEHSTSTDTGATTAPATDVGGMSYEELFKKLNPYTPPTPEELEKEKKKQKREQIINAIGDGVYALSNLFFTTQYAPNMYKEGSNLTEKAQVRYDKMIKERKDNDLAYYNSIMRAKQADERKSEAERAWERQLGLDAERKKQREEDLAHRREREKLADDRYNAEQEYKKGRDKNADDKWNKQFAEGQRRANQSHALAVQRQKDSVEIQKQRIKESGARGVRGNQLGFSDGDGNQVSIYENVWKGSMQQVYDVLAEDMRAAYEADKQHNPRVPRHKTEKEKEDYVKQNWHKSPRAASIMLALSKIDPATMRSEISEDDDDFESYRADEEDDFEQYKQN